MCVLSDNKVVKQLDAINKENDIIVLSLHQNSFSRRTEKQMFDLSWIKIHRDKLVSQ